MTAGTGDGYSDCAVGSSPELLGMFDEMRFHLDYTGFLPSVGNAASGLSRPKMAAIWDIRTQVGRQLARLWSTHHLFRGESGPQARAAAYELNRPIISEGVQFLALVRTGLKLRCELDIVMHVNHEIASVLTRTGDLDNRVKCMIDALRIPRGAHEFRYHPPLDDGCYCLFEDDALMTALSIKMTQWLGGASAPEDHAKLDIGVTVLPAVGDLLNTAFVND